MSGNVGFLSKREFRRTEVKNIGALFHGLLKRYDVRAGELSRSLRLHNDSAKQTNIKEIAKKTKLEYAYKAIKKGEMFDVGIRRVYFNGTPLWLVVSRRRRGGLIPIRMHTIKSDSILPFGNIFPKGGKGNEKGCHCFAFVVF